jgi:peptidylprolyl isomerase
MIPHGVASVQQPGLGSPAREPRRTFAVMRTVIVVATLVVASACIHRSPSLPAPIPAVEGERRVAFALRHIDVAPGAGALAEPRKCLYAHYTGWLTHGTKFDSSRDTAANGQPRTPISFPQGSRRVIAGWDLGFEGMRVGARRRLFIPYQLAYGEAGRPPVIPPKSELIFDVELMAVADTLPRVAAPEPSSRAPTPPSPQCPTWAAVSGNR